jgi:hypothetical protein
MLNLLNFDFLLINNLISLKEQNMYLNIIFLCYQNMRIIININLIN